MENQKKAPFEIVIRTLDPEYLKRGGPAEQVVPCTGYLLAVHTDDCTECHAQGELNALATATTLTRAIKEPMIWMMALSKNAGNGEG